ncbi:glycosyltransferase family 39 protein [soil metagenome]
MTVLDRPPALERTDPLSTRRGLAPLLIGVFGFLVAVAGTWIPSVWFDEAATITATQRSWPQLLQMLTSVDAVHGLYYAGMHVWFDLVGYTPFTLRLPSALAVGATAALLVVLVRMLGSARTAIIAGLVFALLPRTTWMGGEGRSYALTALLAVAMTIAFLVAVRSHARRSWVLYGVLALLGITTFLYVALLVVAHGVTLLLLTRRSSRTAPVSARSLREWTTDVRVRRWLLVVGIAAAVLLPFALLVAAQSAQVSWISPLGHHTWRDVFVGQWFYKNPLFAVVGWPLMVLGGYLAVRRTRTSLTSSAPEFAPRTLAAIVLPWLVVPTVGLLVVSALGSPLYSPRYVAFATPAAAVLIAVALAPLGRRVFGRADLIVALVALAAIAAPHYIAQRMPEAKQHSSWSEVASFIAAERTAPSAATSVTAPQAIIYGPVRKHLAATTRVIEYAYPKAFDGLIDVKLKTPAAETGKLWETRYPLAEVTSRLDGVDTVWLVTSTKQDWRPSVTTALAAEGYAPDGEWSFTNVNVLRFTR